MAVIYLYWGEPSSYQSQNDYDALRIANGDTFMCEKSIEIFKDLDMIKPEDVSDLATINAYYNGSWHVCHRADFFITHN